MASTKDPRINVNVGIEQINSTLLDRATDLLGFINGTIGFEGTGSQNFTIINNGALGETTLAIHQIENNSNQPQWVEAKKVLFQAAPYRLNEIKAKLNANIDAIKNDIAGSIENLFSVVQEKEKDFNPLEDNVRNASSYDDVLVSGGRLENAILNLEKIAKDIAEIYFSTQFSLNGLDLRIEEEIFGLLGGEDKEYSNGTTETPKYFISFSKRDVSKTDIYNRVTNELKTAYEAENGANSWTKENYLKKMFKTKQIELSDTTLKAILADKNKNKKDFKNDGEILKLVTNFEDLMRIIGANENNQETSIERLFKEHLTKYTPPNQLIDTNDSNAFIEHGLKQLEQFTRDGLGDSGWDNGAENFTLGDKTLSINFGVLENSLSNLIRGGKLKLDPELIQTIIQNKNINSSALARFKSSEDFLKILSKEELYTIAGQHYGLSDNKNIALKLFEENLKINTPIYYEDQRSVYDILAGKNNNNGDANNLNKIFSSIENQIKGLGATAKNLLSHGYDKPARNNLQQYLRDNPLETAIYLETYLKNNSESLSDPEKIKITQNISKLLDRFDLMIKEQINESNKESFDQIRELKLALKNYKPETGKNIENIASKFSALGANLKNKFNFQPWPENLRETSPENLTNIEAEMQEDTKFFNAHQALFAAEMQEAGKINAQQFGRKLAEPRADGSMPDTQEPIAPLIGPSLLSSVIVSIGNQALERANSIIAGDHPDKDWLTEKSSFLKNLDESLQTLPSDTNRSQQFINALKNAFIPIIKQFLENKSDTKSAADRAKANLVNHNTNIVKLQILSGTSAGFGFGTGDLWSDLNQIETSLPELMNPAEVNINSNKISKAGLETTKIFLETSASNLQEAILNASEGTNLEDLQNKLSKVFDLLYGEDGNSINPQTGSINERFSSFTNDVNSACSDKPENVDKMSFLRNKQNGLINEYKTAIVNYSDDLTNINDSDNFDIKDAFKNAIDNASSDINGDGVLDPALDSDRNGVNDFEDLKRLANMISGGSDSLANTLENVFGSANETGKDIKQMGIRRLILMMFIFTMFESSEWDYQRQEADTSRYQVW
jgi:hypothetical protein